MKSNLLIIDDDELIRALHAEHGDALFAHADARMYSGKFARSTRTAG